MNDDDDVTLVAMAAPAKQCPPGEHPMLTSHECLCVSGEAKPVNCAGLGHSHEHISSEGTIECQRKTIEALRTERDRWKEEAEGQWDTIDSIRALIERSP